MCLGEVTFGVQWSICLRVCVLVRVLTAAERLWLELNPGAGGDVGLYHWCTINMKLNITTLVYKERLSVRL